MVAILALVCAQWTGVVVALRNAGGRFGFFARGVDDLLRLTHPATRWVINFGTKRIV